MKKIIVTIALIVAGIATSTMFTGCAVPESVASKSGAQLWGENCLRCHNSPTPADYSDGEWAAIGVHMKLRTNSLTETEITKVVEFLQSAN
ncbi:MAG: cytochrome c [Bacteroidota bacterium]